MPDFLELGLSADSDMADTIEELQEISFSTNSDAHSPWPHRLGREFNEIDVQKINFKNIKDAVLNQKITANYGFDPRLGKYHATACSKCYTKYSIEDAIKMKMKCRCGGRIKKGVDYRIHELSKWKKPHHPPHRPPYIHILPLAEIIRFDGLYHLKDFWHIRRGNYTTNNTCYLRIVTVPASFKK